MESYELILHEGNFKVVERGSSGNLPYRIRYMGIFLVIEMRSGIVVSWDRKTSVFVRLQQHYKASVATRNYATRLSSGRSNAGS